MGKHANSRVFAVRLPSELADRIDHAASALGMTRNEFLLRRLRASFDGALEHRKTVEDSREAVSDSHEWRIV